jgi:hypothetical protein
MTLPSKKGWGMIVRNADKIAVTPIVTKVVLPISIPNVAFASAASMVIDRSPCVTLKMEVNRIRIVPSNLIHMVRSFSFQIASALTLR